MKSLGKGFGRKNWFFAGGHIPLLSHGVEPEFTSHDKVAILNANNSDACVRMTIFYEKRIPVTDYELKVKANRIRKVRFNDLIDPLPIPLDLPFGFQVESDLEVIVQFSRMSTWNKNFTGFCVTPFSKNNE